MVGGLQDWRIGEVWGMREDEGETPNTFQRTMAGQWDPWVWLAVGILAQYWEGLYRDIVQEVQARATAHSVGRLLAASPEKHPSVECP